MNRWGFRDYVTKEAREGIAIDLDEYYKQRVIKSAEAAGHQVIGDAEVRWTPIWQTDPVARSWYPSSVRDDDWEVRAWVRIAEAATV